VVLRATEPSLTRSLARKQEAYDMITLRELLHTVVDRLSWRNESDVIQAHSDVDEVFSEDMPHFGKTPGVVNVDGETVDFPPKAAE